MLSTERIGAFAEYVVRPMTEDIRIIFEKAKDLNLPITGDLIKRVGTGLAICHLVSEIIRAVTYIAITVVVCLTVIQVLK